MQLFESYHMLVNSFLLVNQKSFVCQPYHYNALFLLLEDNILCVFFYLCYLQMIKEKVYLLPENLEQLINLNMGLALVLLLLIDVCSN